MNYTEDMFVLRLNMLAPAWVKVINSYDLMYEVFTFFSADTKEFETMEDKEFLCFVNHAMLNWDI